MHKYDVYKYLLQEYRVYGCVHFKKSKVASWDYLCG